MPPKHDQLHYALTNDDRHMGAAAFEDRLRIGNKVANLLGVDRYSDPERVWAQFLEFESQQARARGISEHHLRTIVEWFQASKPKTASSCSISPASPTNGSTSALGTLGTTWVR